MKASETELRNIFEGTKQYVVPLFQRSYDWGKKEWEVLWDDIMELYEMENTRNHFLGSIVTMPITPVPEGVTKFLLIDGQQRFTTIFIILSILRDKSLKNEREKIAEEITNTLLTNPYKKEGPDYFKLLPTNIDREIFEKLIKKEDISGVSDHNILKAYEFFEKKINKNDFDIEKIKNLVINNLIVVSIVLDRDDNPHLVFESLNAKGRPLTQSDLIRNYFLMKFPINEQENIHSTYWKPMQDALGDNMTDFIRHYLMKDGEQVKQNEIYFSLKEDIEKNNRDPEKYLENILFYSRYYEKLLNPEKEQNFEIKKMLKRINRLEVTTAYPFLLNVFREFYESNQDKLLEVLKIIENFIIRRFVCNIPTNQLNKIFPSLYLETKNKNGDFIENIKTILQRKNYPKDNEFKKNFTEINFYGAGDRQVKTKLILESIEESYSHKEQVLFENLTIEHIMPQTLTEWWQNHLGDDWEITHELLLNTIGNLTLTAYNAELSNDDFKTKKEYLVNKSHLEMNKYFRDVDSWKREDIEKRSQELTEKAISIWPYFGDDNTTQNNHDITGSTPKSLYILGQKFEVKTWRDVMEKTLKCIIELEPEKLDEIIKLYPRFVGRNSEKFRAVRELNKGIFIEVNLSAKDIYRFCVQLIETVGLSSENWKIEYY